MTPAAPQPNSLPQHTQPFAGDIQRLIDHMRHHEGVRFMTLGAICQEFKKKNPPPVKAARRGR